MKQKLPFYMAYPFPAMWDDERINRRDYEYMKSVYPDTAKKLLPYVEAECDRLEYDNSMMFDEYPDQLQLRLMCRRIYNNTKNLVENPGEWLSELIHVMAFQELCQRRHEYRRNRRRFY